MLLPGLALKAQSPADKPYLTQPDPQIAAGIFQVVNGRGEHSTIKIENVYLIHFLATGMWPPNMATGT